MDVASIIIFIIIGVLVVINGVAAWRHVTSEHVDRGWLRRSRLMFAVCILLLAIVVIILINR